MRIRSRVRRKRSTAWPRIVAEQCKRLLPLGDKKEIAAWLLCGTRHQQPAVRSGPESACATMPEPTIDPSEAFARDMRLIKG